MDKWLSYRRETALQGVLAMARSGRLALGDDICKYYVNVNVNVNQEFLACAWLKC